MGIRRPDAKPLPPMSVTESEGIISGKGAGVHLGESAAAQGAAAGVPDQVHDASFLVRFEMTTWTDLSFLLTRAELMTIASPGCSTAI